MPPVGPDVVVPLTGETRYFVGVSNSVTGGQIGGDVWVTLVPGLRLGTELKGGLYGNRATQRTIIRTESNVPELDPMGGIANNRTVFRDVEEADGDEFTTMLEWELAINYQLSESIAFRAGYNLMYIDGVAVATENINTAQPFVAPINRRVHIVTDANVFMHGMNLGFEYMW